MSKSKTKVLRKCDICGEASEVDLDNGICLCNHCHKQFHKIYGKKRNNQNQLNEFLGE